MDICVRGSQFVDGGGGEKKLIFNFSRKARSRSAGQFSIYNDTNNLRVSFTRDTVYKIRLGGVIAVLALVSWSLGRIAVCVAGRMGEVFYRGNLGN